MVATILILIALTITPTILNLILVSASTETALINLGFALLFFILMIIADRLLPGIWKTTMIVRAIIVGSVCYLLLLPPEALRDRGQLGLVSNFFTDFTAILIWEPGLLISFLICFSALSINDLGSIKAVGQLIKAPDMKRRVTAGITLSGLANVLAGIFGVIGPVNFSMSAGIIADNGNDSRFTLLPTSLGLLAMAFLPGGSGFCLECTFRRGGNDPALYHVLPIVRWVDGSLWYERFRVSGWPCRWYFHDGKHLGVLPACCCHGHVSPFAHVDCLPTKANLAPSSSKNFSRCRINPVSISRS